MSKTVKYTENGEIGVIRRGNIALGVDNLDYGPTSVTGFYKSVLVPEGGYVTYIYKNSELSYNIANNDSELISFISGEKGETVNTVSEALVWVDSQPNYLTTNRNFETIVTSDLGINIDAGFVASYPTSGTTLYNLNGDNSQLTLNNGLVFDTNGEFIFDGIDDYIEIPSTVNEYVQSTGITITSWVKFGSYINTFVDQSGSNTYPLFQKPVGNTLYGNPSLRFRKINRDTTVSINFDCPGLNTVSKSNVSLNTNQWYFLASTIVPNEVSPTIVHTPNISSAVPSVGEACYFWNDEFFQYESIEVSQIKLNAIDANGNNVLPYFETMKYNLETFSTLTRYDQVLNNGNYTRYTIGSIDITNNIITLNVSNRSANSNYQISPELSISSTTFNQFGSVLFLNDSLIASNGTFGGVNYSGIVEGPWVVGKTNAPLYFRGSLSKLQVYKKSLELSEILEIFNNQKSRYGY